MIQRASSDWHLEMTHAPVSAAVLASAGPPAAPSPSASASAVAAAVLFTAGVVSMYCLWLLAICASFVFVRVDNLRFLLWSASDAGRWPIDVFSGAARFALTAVVPVALITSFQAEALRGTWTTQTLVQAGVVTAVFVVGSRLMWRWSVARYTSASS